MENVSALIAKSQAGDKEAREVLIEKNLGLVRHIAKRFSGRGVDSEDLFQIGAIGLIKAIDKFDLSLGLQFSTYAVPLIMGEIRRFLRDDGLVKISRAVKENSARLALVRERLFGELGREPCLEELIQASGMTKEETLLALDADNCVDSLEEGLETEGGTMLPLLERIAGDAEGGGARASLYPGVRDPEKEKLLDRMLLKQLLEELAEDDKKLIWLRYFRDKSQTETAQSLGISQVQVSRREKKILQQLRERAIS